MYSHNERGFEQESGDVVEVIRANGSAASWLGPHELQKRTTKVPRGRLTARTVWWPIRILVTFSGSGSIRNHLPSGPHNAPHNGQFSMAGVWQNGHSVSKFPWSL